MLWRWGYNIFFWKSSNLKTNNTIAFNSSKAFRWYKFYLNPTPGLEIILFWSLTNHIRPFQRCVATWPYLGHVALPHHCSVVHVIWVLLHVAHMALPRHYSVGFTSLGSCCAWLTWHCHVSKMGSTSSMGSFVASIWYLLGLCGTATSIRVYGPLGPLPYCFASFHHYILSMDNLTLQCSDGSYHL